MSVPYTSQIWIYGSQPAGLGDKTIARSSDTAEKISKIN